MNDVINMIPNVLETTLSTMVPISLAALGGVFSVRVGIMALGLEGYMLTGAFAATYGSYISGSPFVGLLFAVLFGGVMGLLHGILTTRYRVNHVISGIGLNMLASGIATLLLQSVWGNRGNSSKVATLSNIFGMSSIFIFMIIVAILSHIYFFKTKSGLRMRMVGENPQAAETVGINVIKMKYIGTAISGMLAGVGGAYLSIDQLNMFTRDMTAGRGYMAVVANILGRYTPFGSLVSGSFFGFANSLQITFQGSGVSNRLVSLIPYVATLLVLVFAGKYVRIPEGMAKNIEK